MCTDFNCGGLKDSWVIKNKLTGETETGIAGGRGEMHSRRETVKQTERGGGEEGERRNIQL